VKILCVEDDPEIRQSLRGYFAGKPSYELTWASSGRDALSEMNRTIFDLILLDLLLMGTMTGWDVAYIKHTDPNLTWIPLVIMTGVRTADVHLGAHRYEESVMAAKVILQKPIDFRALERVLLSVGSDLEPVTKVEGQKLPPQGKESA
jgi:CheY-like chemotaxis protein